MPHKVEQKFRPADRGFSLIELMMVVALLSIVLGAVFSQINNVQRNYRVQETKVDAIQEGREFIDQMTRDLHQAGYPSQEMYGSGVLMSPAANDAKNAVGLVKVSNSELWFEGDLDGSGVQSVHYALFDSSGNQVTSSSTCPCSLRRSAVLKVHATAPLSQSSDYNSALNNILNSGGVGSGGAALTITGSAKVGGGGGTTTSYDTLYATYKTPAVFTAYDNTGAQVTLPTDISSSPSTLATIRTIQITLNIMARYQDQQTNVTPVIPLTARVEFLNP